MATVTRDDVIASLTAPGAPFEIASTFADGAPQRGYRHAPASLRDVFLEAERYGDAELIVFEDVRLTYAEHAGQVRRLARFLAVDTGIAAGERVAIAMRNLPEWSVAFWATQLIGAVAVPLNAWWTGPELRFALDDSGAVALLADPERIERLATTSGFGDSLRATIVVGDAEGALRFDDVLAGARGDLPDVAIASDDVSTIVYTSGTTGTPKGAVHLHRNHCSSIMNNRLFLEVGRVLSGGDPGPQVTLLTFPLFHIAGLVNLYLPVATGSKVVMLRRWDTDTAVELILDEGVTSTAVVPTVLRQLLDDDRLATDPRLRLASLAAGGASVPGELVTRVWDRFDGRVSPGNGYGLTETTAGAISISGEEYVRNPSSIGRPMPIVDVRIVDERGADVSPGETGELWIRGSTVVPRYWNNPTATADAFTGGWFHTGDLGRVDDHGRYAIVDRLKDVVIRGGENVYSAEVESVLVQHPQISEAAVFGLPHEQLGEEVVAVVAFVDEAADSEEIRRHVGERLAYFKVPARVFAWPTELPRTASGKVLKRELREQVQGKES